MQFLFQVIAKPITGSKLLTHSLLPRTYGVMASLGRDMLQQFSPYISLFEKNVLNNIWYMG